MDLDSFKTRVSTVMATTPVLRVFHHLGAERMLRDAGLALWLGAVLLQPVLWRPDLLHPTTIGTDSSNYAAAAERVAAGHDLYALVEGDRPAPLDNPPEWTVPILSAPPVGIAYLWEELFPEGAGMYIAWIAGIGAMAIMGQILAIAARPVFVVLLIYLIPGLAVTTWSGNVNALIAPGAMFTWWASQQPERRWQALAGVIVAIAAAVKIGPLFLGVWLVAQRRWHAVLAGLAAGVVIIFAIVLLMGPNALWEYIEIARSAVGEPTPLSIPGIVRDLGAPPDIQSIALPAAIVLAVVLMFVWRRSPGSFALAVLAMIYSTPVVRQETAALAIVAAVAWVPGSFRLGAPLLPLKRTLLVPPIAAGVALTAVIIVVSLSTGGTERSTFAIANRTSQDVVVRFALNVQRASFAYEVRRGESAYGWLDRAGAGPPLATIWSTDCRLLDVVEVPRSGISLVLDEAGARHAAVSMPTQAFAPYSPKCFEPMWHYLDSR